MYKIEVFGMLIAVLFFMAIGQEVPTQEIINIDGMKAVESFVKNGGGVTIVNFMQDKTRSAEMCKSSDCILSVYGKIMIDPKTNAINADKLLNRARSLLREMKVAVRNCTNAKIVRHNRTRILCQSMIFTRIGIQRYTPLRDAKRK